MHKPRLSESLAFAPARQQWVAGPKQSVAPDSSKGSRTRVSVREKGRFILALRRT